MFSVSLDEALGLRNFAQLSKAFQALSVTPALCERLALPLQALLRQMYAHAKHFGTAPNLNPLEPDNFLSAKSRRSANYNSLFSSVLLSQRSQFLYKITTLIEMVEDLKKTFLRALVALNEMNPDPRKPEWQILDSIHYDLNTCLRESAVILKCFLHALPEAQVEEFATGLKKRSELVVAPTPTVKRHVTHRRMSLVKGQ